MDPKVFAGTQLGPNFFWRDPIVDPNDLKLVAVHAGSDASKPTVPTHAAVPNKRFCSKLYAKTQLGPKLGPQLGQRLGPRFGPSYLKLGPKLGPSTKNWVPIGSLHGNLGP